MKHTRLLSFVVSLCVVFAVSAQEKPTSINLNIKNLTLRDAYEDRDELRSDNVLSVSSYKPYQKGITFPKARKINNQLYQLNSYREYLPDGRKRLAKYYIDNSEGVVRYYYDSVFNKLLVREDTESSKTRTYNWLFYNQKSDLVEEFGYSLAPDNSFEYQSYTRNSIRYSGKSTRVEVLTYGADGVPAQPAVYVFSPGSYTATVPTYQAKWQKFKIINGSYYPVETKGLVSADRNACYTYDDEGYLLTETWYQPDNKPENKTEYSYSDKHRERVEQKYQNEATEKSNRTLSKYDRYNNLIFEQTTEYTGTMLDAKVIDYVYDEKGNWTERKEYRQHCVSGQLGRKELTGCQLREIRYYQPGQQPEVWKLPALPPQLNDLRKTIPQQAGKKQKEVTQYKNAIKSGDYDTEITQKTAAGLSGFTPKYWTVNQTVYGDLDNVPGDEAVVVYNMPAETESGHQRRLALYRKENGLWSLWHQTSSPVMSDDAGGMMGDPLQSVKIEQKGIVIVHMGGSREKWTYTHRYQCLNNKWYLTGAHISFGAPCDYFETLDFNLLTGDINVSKVVQRCTEKANGPEKLLWREKFKLTKALPLMDDFIPGENLVQISKRKDEIYY